MEEKKKPAPTKKMVPLQKVKRRAVYRPKKWWEKIWDNKKMMTWIGIGVAVVGFMFVGVVGLGALVYIKKKKKSKQIGLQEYHFPMDEQTANSLRNSPKTPTFWEKEVSRFEFLNYEQK